MGTELEVGTRPLLSPVKSLRARSNLKEGEIIDYIIYFTHKRFILKDGQVQQQTSSATSLGPRPGGVSRNRAEQSRTEQNRAEQSGTERNRAEQSGTERIRAEQSGSERNRAD